MLRHDGFHFGTAVQNLEALLDDSGRTTVRSNLCHSKMSLVNELVDSAVGATSDERGFFYSHDTAPRSFVRFRVFGKGAAHYAPGGAA